MIETLSLRNFKVLREVDVRLRPLTLIVGPNASGKSTLLQTLAGITHFLGGGWPDSLLSVSRSFVVNGPMVLKCSGQLAGQELVFLIYPESSKFEVKWGDLEFEEGVPWPAAIKKAIHLAFVMSLDPRRMAAPSLLKETSQTLPSNGEGLSTILADLHLEHPSRYQDLIAQLREVISTVRDLRVRRTGEKFELLFDMVGAQGIPASAVSEGTLLTLGLLTLLVLPNPPQLILIDDLERGLHPRAMGSLIKQFRLLQQQNPDLQIVATTHSPYLLDYVEADEVLLASLSEDGYAAVKPLTDHPDYERWKDVMAPGEFWSTVGERWVTEQPHK